jgi:hypothetical protein
MEIDNPNVVTIKKPKTAIVKQYSITASAPDAIILLENNFDLTINKKIIVTVKDTAIVTNGLINLLNFNSFFFKVFSYAS